MSISAVEPLCLYVALPEVSATSERAIMRYEEPLSPRTIRKLPESLKGGWPSVTCTKNVQPPMDDGASTATVLTVRPQKRQSRRGKNRRATGKRFIIGNGRLSLIVPGSFVRKTGFQQVKYTE